MSRLRRKAYVDLDPGFTQFWHADGTGGRPRRARHLLHGGREHRPPGLRRSRPAASTGRPVRPPVVLERLAGRRRRRRGALHHGRGMARRVRPRRARRAHLRAEGARVPQGDRAARAGRRCDFEIALDIYPGDDRDREALEANGWQLVDPRATVRGPARVPRLRAGLGRRVLRRAGHLRGDEQRLVQRPHRALPGVGTPGAACRTPASARNYPVGEGLVAFTRPRRGRWRARSGSPRTTSTTRAARALAEERFDSDKVLPRFLEEAGVGA